LSESPSFFRPPGPKGGPGGGPGRGGAGETNKKSGLGRVFNYFLGGGWGWAGGAGHFFPKFGPGVLFGRFLGRRGGGAAQRGFFFFFAPPPPGGRVVWSGGGAPRHLKFGFQIHQKNEKKIPACGGGPPLAQANLWPAFEGQQGGGGRAPGGRGAGGETPPSYVLQGIRPSGKFMDSPLFFFSFSLLSVVGFFVVFWKKTEGIPNGSKGVFSGKY